MLTIAEARSPQYVNDTQDAIMLQVRFEGEDDWHCYVCRSDDPHGDSEALFLASIEGVFGPVAAPVPAPKAIPQEIEKTQFIRACVQLRIITADEGEAYLARGELPAMMSGALDKLPEEVRADARLKAIGSTSFSRGDDIFKALVAFNVTTDEAIDAVFTLGAVLN
jgi:hypothetical protein